MIKLSDAARVAPALRMAAAGNGTASAVFLGDAPEDRTIKEEEIGQYSFKSGAARIRVQGIGTFGVGKNRAAAMGAADGEKTGRMAGKVALITGSAQGFGWGIAKELAREGAYLMIADVNEQGAARAAKALNEEFGETTAEAVAADVTREEDVAAMAEETALRFGGIDLFISNAGILKAGGVDELSLEEFNTMTAVNYTAYFLGVKYVSAMMKIQHQYAPARLFDIIEINSKSGLSGSKKNFAYAGSKFGGIGLTQSFALELVQDGIKVNAVCPGNFLDGPLWADPEKGLFVQYLKAGKVPGARTVEDVRAYYEAKVPMGRGCTPKDVARAVFYLVEQEYETGQALAVTGGQEMLR